MEGVGQECIDGVFYCFVSRHTYGNESKDEWLRQTAINASLIKSTNHGLTWTRTASENYARPMWPGGRFGAPYFIHYGQNGGSETNDAADRYVYAISNNGFWDDGDDYILAWVARNKIANLNASDWTYYTGGDGLSPQNWSEAISNAVPILTAPRQCGTTAPCYTPALRVYLTVVWYTARKLPSWFKPNEMKHDSYQAEHPWAPRILINGCTDKSLNPPGHMYGPNVCAKFQQTTGSDASIWLFHSGCPFQIVPAGLYKFWGVRWCCGRHRRQKQPGSMHTDASVAYQGTWVASQQRGYNDYEHDVHYATTVAIRWNANSRGPGSSTSQRKAANWDALMSI